MKGCNVGFGSPREQPRGSFLIGSGGQSETDFQVEEKKGILSKNKTREEKKKRYSHKIEEIFTMRPR